MGRLDRAAWLSPRWARFGLLVVAYGLWVLDDRGVLCRPDSLLQGHAAWHTLTAVSALMLVLQTLTRGLRRLSAGEVTSAGSA